jgi:stage III sporulation protein SpoIIIAA
VTAGFSSQPVPQIGSTRCLPKPGKIQQAGLLERVALHHRPDVMVVGQLSTEQDVSAAVNIARSQHVLLVAAAPARDLQELLQDATLCQLVGASHAPSDTTTTSSGSSSITVEPVLQRARLAPFAIAAELLSSNR